jgi:hypothetical protein
MREIIMYFAVILPDGTDRLVVASQEIKTDRKKRLFSAQKIFTFDTIDGEEVFPGNDHRSFVTRDGIVLKVIGNGMLIPNPQNRGMRIVGSGGLQRRV